jgi:outer membrane lipoprotein-sorting protein
MRSILLLLALASSAAAQPQPNAQVVLANAQKHYASVSKMSAQFRQVVTNPTFGTTQKSDGMLWAVKPSDIRADYFSKGPSGVHQDKTFVFNGSTLWVVDHKNRQIVQQGVQGNAMPAAVSFLTGSGNLGAQFNVALSTSSAYAAKGMIVLELTPKQPSAQYKQLFFVVDPSDWHINESVVIDANGVANEFHFYAPNLQPTVAAGWFQVNPASLPTYRLVQAPTAPASAPAPAKPTP